MSGFDRVQRILALVSVDAGQCPPADASCQPHTLLKQAAASAGAHLYRDCDNAEVSQWLSLSRALCEGTDKKSTLLTQVDSALSARSFLLPAACSCGLADLAVFDAVQQPKVAPECVAFPNVCRWARQMSGMLGVPLAFSVPFTPTVFPLALPSPDCSAAAQKEQKETKTCPPASAKKEIPPMSEKQLAKQKEKAAKKEKAAQQAAGKKDQEKAAPDADLDPSKLDFRVGRVLKCWPHPEAEKLLCEEIDMGNGEVRQIASGIKEFYAPEEVQGRTVIVLCNLKDRNLVGFKSQGMVICASNADHSVVKLLEPPAAAEPGDCVSFPGFGLEEELAEGGKRREPATSSQVAKKKVLEKLAPGLHTDSSGTAMWGTNAFTVGTKGTVGSALPNGVVG